MQSMLRSTISRCFLPLCAASTLLAACATTTTRDSVAPARATTSEASAPAQEGGDMQLPPGWTQADMQACMEAGQPGEMHALLRQTTGKWSGKTTMWMAPGSQPMESPVSMSVTEILGGRYIRCEYSGTMPGSGPFQGLGFAGYDNVAKHFVSTWMDNHGSGIMVGEGKLSPDQKTIEWSYTYQCPIRKAPATMREIQHHDGDNYSLEMHGADPKTGVEFKMMRIDMKRSNGRG